MRTAGPGSLVANSAWNYAGAVITLAVTLVTVPIYIAGLGLERYGIFALLSALLAPFGVLNLGVTQSAVKYIASFTAAGDAAAARETLSAALCINLLYSAVACGACVAMAPWLLRLGFRIPADEIPDAEWALRLMALQWLVAVVAGNLRAAAEGVRDYRVVFWGDALTTVLSASVCSYLALTTGRLSGFVLGQVGVGCVAVVYWAFRADQSLGGLVWRWRGIRARLALVYGYSSWQGLNAGVALLANVGDRYFIGLLLSAATLGAYSVALRLQAAARMLFVAVNQALFPAASAAAAAPGAAERLVNSATWHVSLLGGSALALAAVCGPGFVALWVGPQVAETISLPLRVLMVTLLFEIPSATGSTYLNARALTRLVALNNVGTTVLTLGLMLVLGFRYGLDGVAWSGLLGLVLTRLPFHVWIHRRYFTSIVTRNDFLRAFYGINLASAFLVAVISPAFDRVFAWIGGIPGFCVGFALAVAVFVPAMLLFVAVGLGQRARLDELCDSIAARRLPLLSGLAARWPHSGRQP